MNSFDCNFSSGIYGIATIEQIKEGKHMYRALEAHFSMYLALKKLYMKKFIDDHLGIEKDLREAVIDAVSNVPEYSKENKDIIRHNHQDVLDVMKSINFSVLQDGFDESLDNQAKFYLIYMNLFERILLFIRATREESWELHLRSLHKLCPFFFSFDMIKYARMTPVYLSQMMDLKENDEKTWIMMMEGGFCSGKSKVPFTSMGAAHGIEQENRSIKVMGGIKGISNSSINLDEYFLSTAEISNIITSFCDKFGISESEACKREDHYQLSGSKNSRIRINVSKISDVFSTYGVSFDATDNVYNVLTMKVLPSKDAEQFLIVKEIGKESYISFVKERIEGESSIWDTIKKIKIPCFTNNNKSTSVKLMVKHYKYGKNQAYEPNFGSIEKPSGD